MKAGGFRARLAAGPSCARCSSRRAPAEVAPAAARPRPRKSGRRSCSSRSTRRAPTRSGPDAAGIADAGVQRARGARTPVPPGVRDGARDAAVAQLDDDRPLSRPATACTRTRATSPATRPLVAERLQQAGYRTAAFVSSFVARAPVRARARIRRLRRRAAGRAAERSRARRRDARSRSSRAAGRERPRFSGCTTTIRTRPTTPPEPFRTRYADASVSRRSRGDGRAARPRWSTASSEQVRRAARRSIVVADHGEGLGDHGEAQHGNLLYQSTMHVPLVMAGPGVTPASSATRRSARAACSTRSSTGPASDAARQPRAAAIRRSSSAKAMKPFLEYGWQPQVMAVAGTHKAILAGRLEVYDVAARSRARRANLGSGADAAARRCARALEDYPVPSPDAARAPDNARRRGAPAPGEPRLRQRRRRAGRRKDAPRPADMTALFDVARAGVGALRRPDDTRRRSRCSRRSSPPIRTTSTRRCGSRPRIRRSATTRRRSQAFQKAARARAALAGRRPTCLHYARGKDWARAAPLLEQVVAESPDRLPALEALATVRERQGRVAEAMASAPADLRAAQRHRGRAGRSSGSWR